MRGREANTDALIAELRAAKLKRPVLLYSPPVDLPKKNPIQWEGEVGGTRRVLPTDNFNDQWIDLGFWVQPDGRVGDIEILRSGGPTDWTPRS